MYQSATIIYNIEKEMIMLARPEHFDSSVALLKIVGRVQKFCRHFK